MSDGGGGASPRKPAGRAPAARVVVWVIDDVADNHDFVRRSLPARFEDVCDLTGYLSAREALEALEVLLSGPNGGRDLPDVVFMDFYLDDRLGDDLTREIRSVFSARGLGGPLIIGHSSARGGSQRILRAGGDVAIEKDRRHPVSPGVRSLFPDHAALRRYAGHARRGVV